MKSSNQFSKDFDEFIYEREETAINNLRRYDKNYNKKKNEFNSLCEKFTKGLTGVQKEDFDKIISTLNSMSSDESVVLYKTAMEDFLYKFKM